MSGALLETVLEDVAGLLGQRIDIAQEDDAHVFALEQRQLIDEGFGKQVHEHVDLVLRAVPVLGRERVGAHDIDAEANAGRDDLAQGYNTRLVAFGASEPARGGPTAVAVHDA